MSFFKSALSEKSERETPKFISPWHRYSRLLREIVQGSKKTFSSPLGGFTHGKSSYHLPRLIFTGQNAESDPIRLAILAGWDGTALAGPRAILEFSQILETEPSLGKGYEIYFYPILNPSGVEQGSLLSRSGKNFLKELGKGSDEPEIYYFEQDLAAKQFHGLIYLTSEPKNLFSIAMSSANLEPVVQAALKAASYFSEAKDISQNNALPKIAKKTLVRSNPFELTLITPQRESFLLQVISTVFALKTILERYREIMAVQPNL